MITSARITLFLFLFFLFLFFPSKVLASVVINEFSSYGSSDWVEIYRTNSENLSLYVLKDGSESGNSKPLSGADCSGEFCTIGWDSKLNNAGDVIKLFLAVDQSSPINQVAYGNMGNNVTAPEAGQSAGRNTDGGSNWVLFSTPTKKASNNGATVVPTSTPSPSPSPTPSPSLENNPSSATSKINEVKDEDGNILSSVKVYVDGTYVHHYAPETLTFCDGCKCDDAGCGFGEHTIKLEKSGFEDWSEKRTINSGDSWEINAVMDKQESDSSSTSSPSPSPTSKATTTTEKTTTTSKYRKESASSKDMLLNDEKIEIGEVLGATESKEEESSSAEATEDKEKKLFIMPFIISGGGLLMLSGAVFPFVRPKVVEFIKKLKIKYKKPKTQTQIF